MGTVTISGNSYTIYGELSTDTPGEPISATTYFAASLNVSAWDAASADDKAKALVNASRIFDRQAWQGTITDSATPQPLAWPRTGAPSCDGIATPSDEIPQRVVFGAYELAAAILADATVQNAANTGSNTKRVLARKKVGDLEVEDETEYFTPTNVGRATGTRFPTQVQELIKCYLDGFAASATVAGAAASVFKSWDFGLSGDGSL